MAGSRDAARAIDLVKYRSNHEAIFGKQETILDKAPLLPARKRKTLRRNCLNRKYL